MRNNKQVLSRDGKLGKDLSFAMRESYNLLRTNLAFSLTDVQGCKVIAITSAFPQEGKSYSSINLAYVLALDNKKVLFLDGDFRKSNVAATLKIDSKPGLVDWFANKSIGIIHKGVLNENLDVVVAGSIPANPSEIIGSSSMKDFLDEAKKSYDYVIIDCPPVGVVSDVLALSTSLNGVILVVRHQFSRLKSVKKSIESLKFSGVKVLGIIYNAFSQKTKGYYKKGYYGDKYYKKSYEK